VGVLDWGPGRGEALKVGMLGRIGRCVGCASRGNRFGDGFDELSVVAIDGLRYCQSILLLLVDQSTGGRSGSGSGSGDSGVRGIVGLILFLLLLHLRDTAFEISEIFYASLQDRQLVHFDTFAGRYHVFQDAELFIHLAASSSFYN
jgi:hypothetical protein